MSIAVLESFGAYHPHHQVLKKLGCSPCERDVFGKIAGLIAKTGKAFICLGEFATDLGYPNCRASPPPKPLRGYRRSTARQFG